MPSDTHSQNESLNATELGVYLSVSCSKSIARTVGRLGLEPVAGGYPWRRIFRAIHGTEGHLLAQHLVALKAAHGTPAFDEITDAGARAAARAAAQGSPIIDAITDLETELKTPLWHFDRMASALGKKPDTLAKAMRQGRLSLPFPTLALGPRLRLYRPLEVRLWCEDGIRLDLPPAMQIRPRTAAQAAEPSLPEPAPTSAQEARKAIFGGFAQARRKSSA